MEDIRCCRRCGSSKGTVYDSRDENGLTIRRRKCKKCGFKWITIEVDYIELLRLQEKIERK